LTDFSQQTFYAIKDTFPSGSTPSVAIFNDPRSLGSFVKQTLMATATGVTGSSNLVDLAVNNGWYFDFVINGERDNTDAKITSGVISFNTNIPLPSSCSAGGDSIHYQVDYRSGTAPVSTLEMGTLYHNISASPSVMQLPDGSSIVCSQGSGGTMDCDKIAPIKKGPPPPPIKSPVRSSWRMLTE
jgi:Tfp pilus tip-associated adhesin PilY1